MSDGDNSLRSVSELGVQNKDWHDNDKSHQGSPEDVDGQGLGKHLISVLNSKAVQALALKISVVVRVAFQCQVGDPF